jgi:1,4-alpha-glucan branching enzyme
MPVNAVAPAASDIGSNVCSGVTFRTSADLGRSAALVGEFNDWSVDATPMDRVGDLFVATVLLERGRSYRYQFVLDGDRWQNDVDADDYVANEHGGYVSVRHI